MNIQELLTSIKPYYQQSQGQLWLLAIVVLAFIMLTTVSFALYDSLKQISFFGQDQTMKKELSATSESTINQLVQSPLFGTSEQSATSHINTNLLLYGVMSSRDQKQARAFIATPGSQAKVYKINDEIADGGRLVSIYPDRVLFQRDGRLETLYLDWNKRTEKSNAPKLTNHNLNNAVDNQSDAPSAEVETPTPVQAPATTQSPTPQTPVDWQERLKELREKYKGQAGFPSGAIPVPAPFAQPGRGGNFRLPRGN